MNFFSLILHKSKPVLVDKGRDTRNREAGYAPRALTRSVNRSSQSDIPSFPQPHRLTCSTDCMKCFSPKLWVGWAKLQFPSYPQPLCWNVMLCPCSLGCSHAGGRSVVNGGGLPSGASLCYREGHGELSPPQCQRTRCDSTLTRRKAGRASS